MSNSLSVTGEQSVIINHPRELGHIRVLAGAGTGKTTTLLNFIINQQASKALGRELVLMYNKDAQADFCDRAVKLHLNNAHNFRTFHAHARYLLLNSPFPLKSKQLSVDTNLRNSLIREALAYTADETDNEDDAQMLSESTTQELLSNFISLVAAHLLPANIVFEELDLTLTYKPIIDAYGHYETLRKNKQLYFFDDWLVEVVRLLEMNESWRLSIQAQYDTIIVDEFQDVNAAQYRFIKALVGAESQLVVVGDVDQTIYAWRGAKPDYLLNFDQDFSPCVTYHLSKSFRFGHQIALPAANLISNNTQRVDFITTSVTSQSSLQVVSTDKPAKHAIHAIQKHVANGGHYRDAAVLVRRWSQSMEIELGCLIRKLPYTMPAEFGIARSKEIRLLLNLTTLATGVYDILDIEQRKTILSECFKYPRVFINNRLIEKLSSMLSQIDHKLWLTVTQKMADTLSAKERWSFSQAINRVRLLRAITMKSSSISAVELLSNYIEDSKWNEWLSKIATSESEIVESQERMHTVVNVLKLMKLSATEALEYFQWLCSLSKAQGQQQQEEDVITVTTIFRAKGKEFPLVLLPGWEDGRFPKDAESTTGPLSSVSLEEERRLAYVAITRTINHCFVFAPYRTSATNQTSVGSECRFIKEMQLDDLSQLQKGSPHNLSEITKRYSEIVGSPLLLK